MPDVVSASVPSYVKFFTDTCGLMGIECVIPPISTNPYVKQLYGKSFDRELQIRNKDLNAVRDQVYRELRMIAIYMKLDMYMEMLQIPGMVIVPLSEIRLMISEPEITVKTESMSSTLSVHTRFMITMSDKSDQVFKDIEALTLSPRCGSAKSKFKD